jgi:hypothetical protein
VEVRDDRDQMAKVEFRLRATTPPLVVDMPLPGR